MKPARSTEKHHAGNSAPVTVLQDGFGLASPSPCWQLHPLLEVRPSLRRAIRHDRGEDHQAAADRAPGHDEERARPAAGHDPPTRREWPRSQTCPSPVRIGEGASDCRRVCALDRMELTLFNANSLIKRDTIPLSKERETRPFLPTFGGKGRKLILWNGDNALKEQGLHFLPLPLKPEEAALEKAYGRPGY
jgi:hypothetical protein